MDFSLLDSSEYCLIWGGSQLTCSLGCVLRPLRLLSQSTMDIMHFEDWCSSLGSIEYDGLLLRGAATYLCVFYDWGRYLDHSILFWLLFSEVGPVLLDYHRVHIFVDMTVCWYDYGHCWTSLFSSDWDWDTGGCSTNRIEPSWGVLGY